MITIFSIIQFHVVFLRNLGYEQGFNWGLRLACIAPSLKMQGHLLNNSHAFS